MAKANKITKGDLNEAFLAGHEQGQECMLEQVKTVLDAQTFFKLMLAISDDEENV